MTLNLNFVAQHKRAIPNYLLGFLYLTSVIYAVNQSHIENGDLSRQQDIFENLRKTKTLMYGDAQAKKTKCEYWVKVYQEAPNQAEEKQLNEVTRQETALSGILGYCR